MLAKLDKQDNYHLSICWYGKYEVQIQRSETVGKKKQKKMQLFSILAALLPSADGKHERC